MQSSILAGNMNIDILALQISTDVREYTILVILSPIFFPGDEFCYIEGKLLDLDGPSLRCHRRLMARRGAAAWLCHGARRQQLPHQCYKRTVIFCNGTMDGDRWRILLHCMNFPD